MNFDNGKPISKIICKVFSASIADLETELMRTIFSINEEEPCSSLIFEVSTGVGGQEAMLFASDLYDMYSGYMAYKGWDIDVLQIDNTELGGKLELRSLIVLLMDCT